MANENDTVGVDAGSAGLDFIRAIVADDLRSGKHTTIVTRFPPEPNGFLHIGHTKAITLNWGIAQETGGVFHLRFDDTNPETEETAYVEAIIEDAKWLGADFGEHLYFASDYFDTMYRCAEHLITTGNAYVDSLNEEEIREYRGTVTEPGRDSPYRARSIEENLDLFRRMRAGEFPDGAHVLRGRIDMASANMLLRDPILYRIRHATHYRTGDAWCIYPLYDYAHPIEDAIEGITHSLCSLEFETNRPLYDWVVENVPLKAKPRQIEFARLNLDYTVMSKRKLLQLVREGHVSGWDDPRMPTVAGLRRRGVTPQALRAFNDMLGIAKTDIRVDIAKLDFAIRDDLNRRARRVLCVLRPLPVQLTNVDAGATEWLDAPYFPHDVRAAEDAAGGEVRQTPETRSFRGSPVAGDSSGRPAAPAAAATEAPAGDADFALDATRALPLTHRILIECDDFMEHPPRGYHRLSPGAEVRLRHGPIIRCDDVVRDDAGAVVALRCSVVPEPAAGERRRVKGTIHWVSEEHSVPCEVRLYDRLFSVPDPEAGVDGATDFKSYLNPDSLDVVTGARVEPAVKDDPPGTRYQFERLGYFCSDAVDSAAGHLVFNRTVTLRDTWAKKAEGGRAGGRESGRRATAVSGAQSMAAGDVTAGTPSPRGTGASSGDAATRVTGATSASVPSAAEVARRDPATAALLAETVAEGGDETLAANWIVNELPRELRGRSIAELPFGGRELAELVKLLQANIVSSSAAREVLAELARGGGSPAAIVRERGLRQLSDEHELWPAVEAVIEENPSKVDEYRAGRSGLLGYFVGQVMRKTNGRANPEVVSRLVQARLG